MTAFPWHDFRPLFFKTRIREKNAKNIIFNLFIRLPNEKKEVKQMPLNKHIILIRFCLFYRHLSFSFFFFLHFKTNIVIHFFFFFILSTKMLQKKSHTHVHPLKRFFFFSSSHIHIDPFLLFNLDQCFPSEESDIVDVHIQQLYYYLLQSLHHY